VEEHSVEQLAFAHLGQRVAQDGCAGEAGRDLEATILEDELLAALGGSLFLLRGGKEREVKGQRNRRLHIRGNAPGLGDVFPARKLIVAWLLNLDISSRLLEDLPNTEHVSII
jgi:hypothetical protein